MNKTKNKIVLAAIEVVSKKGYHPATMDEIAKEANVAKGTLYYYFESKEAIFNNMIESGLELIKAEILNKIEGKDDSMEQLRIVTHVVMELVFARRNLFKIIISQLWGDDNRQVALRTKMNDVMSFLEVYIIKCVEAGKLKTENTRLLAFNYFGLMVTATVYHLTQEPIVEKVSAEMVESIIDQISWSA